MNFHQPVYLKLKKFMKKGKIIIILVAVYVLIGIFMYFSEGEVHGIYFTERVPSFITVTFAWPFLLVGKVFWN